MKKKILALCLVVALLATAIAGATLAYFTDTDAQKNTFTTGNVAIDLFEDFGDNTGSAELIPATGSVADGTLKNAVEKEVYIENTGSEDAYVRVHIAIPSILDDGAETFDAGKNVLHFNADDATYGEGKWDWSKAADDDEYFGNWNYYTTTIGGKSYNVYVVTYTTALAKDDITPDAIEQVYLDSKVTNEDINKIKAELGEEWFIYVAAEAAQEAGFENAYDALNEAFGVPGAYDGVDWTVVTGETFVERTSAAGD